MHIDETVYPVLYGTVPVPGRWLCILIAENIAGLKNILMTGVLTIFEYFLSQFYLQLFVRPS